MTDPVQVVAEAPCVRTGLDTCHGNIVKHPECAVAALKAAGALMPGEARQLRDDYEALGALYKTRGDRLEVHAAPLQEAASVLGQHQRSVRRRKLTPEEAEELRSEVDWPTLDLGVMCPYYARHYSLEGHDPEAVCSMGCVDEPGCVTGEPREGWPSTTIRRQAAALDEQAALLQEVREVLGRHQQNTEPGYHEYGNDTCRSCTADWPCPEASLLQKIDRSAPRPSPAPSSHGGAGVGEDG